MRSKRREIAAGTAAATAMSSNNNQALAAASAASINAIIFGVRDCFGYRAGMRWGIRFDSALAEYWTLSRRSDTRHLRCAVAAERFLHGAGEWRRF